MKDGRGVILLVEDNRDDVGLTLRALRLNGTAHDVVVAPNGVDALDYLLGSGRYADRDTTQQPKLILLDVRLPLVNGMDVLERIRSDERTRLLRVAVMTDYPDEVDLARLSALGIERVVSKPMDFHRLVEATRELLTVL